MRFWTLIKLAAGIGVVAVATLTAMLYWHVYRHPLDGMFSEWIPVEMTRKPMEELPSAQANLPEIDPGAKVFERARELIAVGDLAGARERLETVVKVYPRSKAAPEARRIVGEMNMDDMLSPRNMEGKTTHVVQRGESFLGIAAKYRTTLDCLMHLNGMVEIGGLHPGDELVVMPLELRVLVEPSRQMLSLWRDGKFVKEYPLAGADPGSLRGGLQTKIAGKSGILGDRKLTPSMKGYRDAVKVFSLEKTTLKIQGVDEAVKPEERSAGFFLNAEDAEELSLLLRPGNEVEIRAPSP